MMVYNNFINKTIKYLKSVRVLKNYVSFDMTFPKTWVFPNNYPAGIEVLTNETDEIVIHSFVSENKNELINGIEKLIDTLIKTNIEREEKEKLFKSKVQELKSIFDKEKLENLKGLKFDIEEFTKLLENGTEKLNTEVEERA
jgi:hypothetical protein